MFWVGKKHFTSLEDYENRFMEVNPIDLVSPRLKELVFGIPKKEISKYILLGKNNYKNEQFEKAIKNFTKVLDYDKNNLSAIFYRGLCYIKLEHFQSAIKDLSNLIQLKPDFVHAHYYRGNARLLIQSYSQIKKAIDDYTLVIESDSSNGLAYYLRGCCYLLLKNENSSFLDWKKAKDLGIAKESEENWKKDYLV